jgi:pyridinium-3,5-biscarboxylic acid mononucleotide synthase
MDTKDLQKLLEKVKAGKVNIDEAVQQLRHMPFEDIGFAKIDHHRQVRCAFGEVIYCPGKTNEQIVEIFKRLAANGNNVLATRAEPEVFESLKSAGISEKLQYEPQGRAVYLQQTPLEPSDDFIAIITAGTSDIPVAMEAKITAEILGQQVKLLCDVGVAGLHRLLDKIEIVQQANVIIVVAGMEGALASVIGGISDCPVIAVPTSVGYGASFEGLAALLAMLNSCASSVTVVNIDNGFGAGYAASLINRKITQKEN